MGNLARHPLRLGGGPLRAGRHEAGGSGGMARFRPAQSGLTISDSRQKASAVGNSREINPMLLKGLLLQLPMQGVKGRLHQENFNLPPF